MDLALNNQQRLICHKTQQTKPNQTKNIASICNSYPVFSSKFIVRVLVMEPYSRTNTAKAWENSRFI